MLKKTTMSYHFKQSKVSNSLDEPVYLTLFRQTIVLPPPLRETFGTELVHEQIKRIGGLTFDKLPETVEQMYKTHKRRFMGVVTDTNVDIEIEYEVNVDPQGRMYPYNVMTAWSKLLYDPNTGFQSIKRDYVGSMTIEVFTKDGQVIRRSFVPIMFPITPPNEMELAHADEAIYTMSVTYAAENFTDEING